MTAPADGPIGPATADGASLVVTGAAGRVAAMVRPYLLRRYGQICLTDLSEPFDLKSGETFHAADIRDLEALRGLFRGRRAVLHLASRLSDADWYQSRETNVDGTFNVFEAARLEGVERVIFASSNHVTGFWPIERNVDVAQAVRPDSYYGVTKVLGEALGLLYADKFGMRTLSIRIGNVSPKPRDLRGLSIWIHPEDLAQLCAIGAEHADLHAETVYGVSATSRGYYDMSCATALGYVPSHCADDFADRFPPASHQADNGTAKAPRFQGGAYVERGFSGDWDRTISAVRRNRANHRAG